MANISHAERLKYLLRKHYRGYDRYIRHVIPKYHEIQNAVLQSIPFKPTDRLAVLELGLGTGETTQRILKKFKRCTVDAIDYSEEFIRVSLRRLKQYRSKLRIFRENFTKVWPPKRFDLIVSTLAIHHVRERDKAPLLKKIYTHLKPGGVFLNGDMVMFDDHYLRRKAEEIYTEFLQAHLTHAEFVLFKRHVRSQDFPVPLESHLSHLERIGFRNVAIVWRYYGFAVYEGVK